MRHAAATDAAWAAWARRPALVVVLTSLLGVAAGGAWWAREQHYRGGAVVDGRVVAVERGVGRAVTALVVERPRADGAVVRFRQRAIAPPQAAGDVVDVSVRDARSRVVDLVPVGPVAVLTTSLCGLALGLLQLAWVAATSRRVSRGGPDRPSSG